MQDIDLEYERYKDFNFSGAEPTKNPKILAMRARKKTHDAFINLFDDDVKKIVLQQDDPKEIIRLNAVIRALYT